MEVVKNFYNLHAQSWPELEKTLGEFALFVDKQKKTSQFYEKLAVYFIPVYELTKTGKLDKFWSFAKAQINLLEADVLTALMAEPEDPELQEIVSREITLLYAGLGFYLPTDPYDALELEKISKGEFVYYDDLVFASTLYHILNSSEPPLNYVGVLPAFLYAQGAKEVREEQNWLELFLVTLIVQVCWKYFNSFSKTNKELLLKNYFYTGIVAGVPVKTITKRYFSIGDDAEIKIRRDFFFSSLQTNIEEVPLNAECSEWRKVVDILKGYSVQLHGEGGSGFLQEEYLKTFYQGQAGREVYQGWLRELLTLVFSIEK